MAFAAVTTAIRRGIEDDRFFHAPRLDPLRSALGKFEAAPEPSMFSKAPPPAKVDKRARRQRLGQKAKGPAQRELAGPSFRSR